MKFNECDQYQYQYAEQDDALSQAVADRLGIEYNERFGRPIEELIARHKEMKQFAGSIAKTEEIALRVASKVWNTQCPE